MTTQLHDPITTTLMEIDPAFAQHLIDTMPYTHQRKVRKQHVEYLADEMLRGSFIPATTIRIMRNGTNQHLVDGQHRLNAVIASGVPVVFNVVEIHATDEEIAREYGLIDIGLRRTPGEAINPHELDVLLGITKRDINDVAAAVAFMASGCEATAASRRRKVHPDDLRRWIVLYAPAMKVYKTIINDAAPGRIRNSALRMSSVAVALLTIRFAAPLAERSNKPDVLNFWRGAIFDDGIAVGDPRKLVNRHLLMTGIGAGTVARGEGLTFVSAPYATRFIATAFNAYMARETRKMIKVVNEAAPLVLFGVPTNHEEWMR